MGLHSIHNYRDLINLCEKSGFATLDHDILTLSKKFSDQTLILENINNLAIIAEKEISRSFITLNKGSYNEISLSKNIELYLYDVEITNSLKCEGVCKIENSKIKYFDSKTERLEIVNCVISELVHYGGVIDIKNSHINRLSFENASIKTNISIENLSHLSIKGLKPINSIDLSLKFLKHSEIHLSGCDFENVSFIDCDFAGAILYSYDSKLNLKGYNNTKWFRSIKKLTADNHETRIIPRDECRQLKLTARASENSIDADLFRAYELHAHYQEIKLFSNRFESKITLALNLITNRFERSWFIPLIWILGFGFIMFIGYYYSSNWWQLDQIHINQHIKLFWIFINPLHNFEMLGANKVTALSLFIDTFHRIFNSYFIYQLVASFRRFKVA